MRSTLFSPVTRMWKDETEGGLGRQGWVVGAELRSQWGWLGSPFQRSSWFWGSSFCFHVWRRKKWKFFTFSLYFSMVVKQEVSTFGFVWFQIKIKLLYQKYVTIVRAVCKPWTKHASHNCKKDTWAELQQTAFLEKVHWRNVEFLVEHKSRFVEKANNF